MENKRKRSFFDDDENQIRKIPKTSNSTTDYSLDTDTEESKSQDLCESTYSRSHVCMSVITISDDSSVEETESLAEDRNAMDYEDLVAVQNICTANSPSESTYSRSHVCMSVITISDDSSVEETESLAEDRNAIDYEDLVAVQNICTANSPSESTYSRSHVCMSVITISDDSSVEETESLAEDRNSMDYEDHVAVQNICTANSPSEGTNNRQHTFRWIIFITDDSSVEETESLAEDRNAMDYEDLVAVQNICTANSPSECTKNGTFACMSVITISDDSSVEETESLAEDRNAMHYYEDHVAVQNICTANSLGETTINRHNGNSSASENLTMGTKRSLHNCPTEVPTFFLTTCEHFEKGSTTHIKLENPNCSKLEDQDFDDKNLLSTSYVPTQKTVLQKCSSAEALETYEYVEHKVPVQNVGCHASIAKVMDWNCDPMSSISYDWNTMDTKLPKKQSKSEHSWSS